MTMAFRMEIEDLFQIGEKTVFTGRLNTQVKMIANVPCRLEIDGNKVGEINIQGEVHTGTPNRDLWTISPVSLTREMLRNHNVCLIAD